MSNSVQLLSVTQIYDIIRENCFEVGFVFLFNIFKLRDIAQRCVLIKSRSRIICGS